MIFLRLLNLFLFFYLFLGRLAGWLVVVVVSAMAMVEIVHGDRATMVGNGGEGSDGG